MHLLKILYGLIDPERLIQAKTWWIIGTLASLAGLLFGAALLLMMLGERSIADTVEMRNRFRETNTLGKELDQLEEHILQYDQNLWNYIQDDNAENFQQISKSQSDLLESGSKLHRFVAQESWSELATLKTLLNGLFINGAQIIEMKRQQQKEAALSTLRMKEIVGIRVSINHLSNRLFRSHVDLLEQKLETDVRVARGYFQYILILLSVLAGIVLVLLIFTINRTVQRVMQDRRSYRELYEKQKNAALFTENLVNMLPIGYHSVNKEGLIIEMNQTELDWLGYKRDELVGRKRIYELYHDEENREGFDELFEKFKKEGYIRNIQLDFTAKDGSVIPVLFNSKAVYHENGELSHSISTIYNFTERKKLEDQLVVARQEAENAQHLKQLFMANMSHEIRTPLNAILGFANLLSRDHAAAQRREYVQNIKVSGINLLAIVNDILDFEKIQSGMLRIEQIEFDLPELLHSVFAMVRPNALEKQLKMRLDIDCELPSKLIGDPTRLNQILINLLSNAVKFTERGAVTLRARILSCPAMDAPVRIRFEVEDTGIGIEASEQSRVFERFTQASADTMRRYGGTGLGLALVKMLVELQNGTIRLDSTVGLGSIFCVEIPYQTIRNDQAPEVGMPAQVETIPDFSGYHVLLVEDNPMNRRIAELQLHEFGLCVTLANNGFDAIKYLKADPGAFHLVFMDIQMPEMDGYATTRMIRSELGRSDLPIIAITAHVLADEQERVLASGMNDCLTKPVRLNELSSILQKHLPGQSAPQEAPWNVSNFN